jgi:hypothetical protein
MGDREFRNNVTWMRAMPSDEWVERWRGMRRG